MQSQGNRGSSPGSELGSRNACDALVSQPLHDQDIGQLRQTHGPSRPLSLRPDVSKALYRGWDIAKVCPRVYLLHTIDKEVSLSRIGRCRTGYKADPYECMGATSLRRDLRYKTYELMDGLGLYRVVES